LQALEVKHQNKQRKTAPNHSLNNKAYDHKPREYKQMPRKSHPKKDIEQALKYAEEKGWIIKVGSSHAWGQMLCPYNNENCRFGKFCQISIWSTPSNPQRHIRQIRKAVDKCIAEEMDA
jgi:hypothetical protein